MNVSKLSDAVEYLMDLMDGDMILDGLYLECFVMINRCGGRNEICWGLCRDFPPIKSSCAERMWVIIFDFVIIFTTFDPPPP